MDTLLKHGSHNQASHNPHKGGESDLPEGWSQRSKDDIRAEYAARFGGQYPNDPQRASDLADDFADRTTEYSGPNGTRVRVELLGGGEPDAAAMRDTMEALNTCQSQMPVDGLVVNFSNRPFRDNADIVRESTKAFVLRGEKEINMRPEYAQGGNLINREEGYMMPSANGVSQVKYVVTHEYGHTLDKRSNRQIGDDYYALRDNGGMAALSTYGRANDYEHFAESWAEWSLTGGSTSNPASTYFAETYDWGSSMTKAADDDVVEQVIILDTFDPAVPPTAVKPLAKSVIVAFEPGLRPVLKHGTHDQSSHGRRGGGGSSLKLDGTVAQSIVERVRANGGLSVNMVDGSEPTKGYMVAMGGTKGAIMDADEFYDPVRGPEALGSFMKANRELSEGSYLGLWHNQADGKVYLDVSENIMDQATAISAGRKRDQISIWDVANFEEIDTGGSGQLAKTSAAPPSGRFSATLSTTNPATRERLPIVVPPLTEKAAIDSLRHGASLGVESRRYEIEVVEVDAVSNSAQVVDLHVVRDGAIGLLPDPSVNHDTDGLSARSTSSESGVTVMGERPCPEQASVSIGGDASGETFLGADRSEAHWETVSQGGTDGLGKAVAGSETAGPEVDDRRGDRRVRKDSVGEVRGRGVVVAFEPGLRPVLKHGSHDQSSHGRRGAGQRFTPGETGPSAEAARRRELTDVPGRYTPSGTETMPKRESPPPVGRRESTPTWQEEYEAQRDAIANALVSGNFDDLNIAPSRLAQQIGAAQGEIMKRVSRIAARVGIKRKKRWGFTDEEATRLRESYYEKYGRPSWMDKAVRRIRKHLGGAHDQKSHGRGGGAGDKGWGDRQKDIDAMASRGPDRDALVAGASGVSDDDVRQYVTETWGDTIEADARQAVTDEMESEGWVDVTTLDESDPRYDPDGPLMGNTYQEEFDERLAQRIEDETDSYVDNYGYDVRESLAQDMGLDVDSFDEVYGISHEGISVTGDRVQLSTRVDSVTTGDAWDQNVDVRGTIYDGNGNQVGEFHRRFFIDDSGKLAASHELLDIYDEQHQGTGFSKVFNKQAEDFYISRGITDIHVHAALSVGGYAWAKQGFDWGQNNGAGWSVKGKMDDILSLASSDPSLGGVVRSGRELRARLDLPSSDPDYPTTREVASWGYVQGASTWPGKATLIGSDWYGKKVLSPEGPRRSTTEQQAAEAAAAEVVEIPGQQALFD